MGQDLINKSIYKNELAPVGNTYIRNLINKTYYFGYGWKERLWRLTNYTHSRSMYKLIINADYYILEKITTYVVINQFKIVSVDFYMSSRGTSDLPLTNDYQDNIDIVEQYMLDENNKSNISKYEFKILENEGIFSVMDCNYNLVEHNGMLYSACNDGYLESSISISFLIEHFIVPG